MNNFFYRYGELLLIGGVFSGICLVFIAIGLDMRKDDQRRAEHAKTQCAVLLERSRTFEDSTDTYKYVVNHRNCLYWSTTND